MMAVNINYQQNTSTCGDWEAAIEGIKESHCGAGALYGWAFAGGSRDANPRIEYFAGTRAPS